MRAAKSKGGKARPGFIRPNWRERIDPAFVAYWSAQRKNRALSKIEDQKGFKRKFQEWFEEGAAASRALHEARGRIKNSVAARIQSAILRPLDTEGPVIVPPVPPGQEATFYPQNPESSGVFRQIVFLKYGITFRELVRQLDMDKNPDAQRKLMAVHRDYWRLQSGVHFEDFKLKFGLDHFQLFAQGFDFGIDKLMPDELADCLDEICPCQQRHSPEYLKKLRTRIKQACKWIL
jgi:hypothetical protein